MSASNFVLADYLARIGLTEAPEVNAIGLAQLLRAQLHSVPFENLDVQAGKLVSLVPEDIVTKIVYQGRGGYCYEVTGILAMALEALGFRFQIIGARPMFYPQRRAKTHVILLVEADGQQWICDAGFGSFGLRAPIGLHQLGQPLVQDNEQFMLVKNQREEYVLQAWVKGEWVNQFGFDLYAMEWVDFVPANFFNSKSPDAVFVQRYLVMLQTPQGRKLLSGDQYKEMTAAGEQTTQISPEQLDAMLWQAFKLKRPAP